MKDVPQIGNYQSRTRGLNGISLGVHEVFDASEQENYLRERFVSWNVSGPLGFHPHLRDLPPVHQEDGLRLGANAKVTGKVVEVYRACAGNVMDHYFPLTESESVVQDILAFTDRTYHSHPPGTGVVIRRTNKAVFFYIDPNVRVEADGTTVTNIQATRYISKSIHVAITSTDPALLLTKIFGLFVDLLPGPVGTAAKIGVALLSMILEEAGSSGPSWSEIQGMMREVVRDELVTNDLEYIQAHYESIKKWSDIQYLPNKESKSEEELWPMLRPQIDIVSQDINLLLQSNHRKQGFGLLLLGVNLYLSLLQEQISLGYKAEIRKSGDQWATDMLKVWEEVKKERHDQIKVVLREKSTYNPYDHDVTTVYYWVWTDQKTNVSRGDSSGPWVAGHKNDRSESDCRADALRHYENFVLPSMRKTFGDPEAAAKAWREVKC
mgnify:CR=1 FL=1